VLIAQMEDAARRLDVVAWDTQQKVRKVGTGFRACERERAVEGRVRGEANLLKLVLAAELYRVRAPHSGQAVAHVQRVADLIDAGDRHAHRKRVEDQIFAAFELRSEDHDARRPGPRDEALLREGDALAAVWNTNIIRVVRQAEVEIVDGVRSEGFRAAHRPELSASQRQCIKAGDIRATLLAG